MPNAIAPVLAVDPVHVFVNCPFCDKVHTHLSDGDTTKSSYGMRLSNCRNIEHGNYELVCDTSTERRLTEFDRNWIKRTFGEIV